MANSNEGQDHKDKYFDTHRKILSQEKIMCKMEALVSYFLRSYDQCKTFFFKYWSNIKVKSLSTNKKILSQGIFIWNIKIIALTIQNLLARVKLKT